jgi:hypothetical protein
MVIPIKKIRMNMPPELERVPGLFYPVGAMNYNNSKEEARKRPRHHVMPRLCLVT